MKYLKTFEYLMNNKIYKIDIFDKTNPDKKKLISSTTITGKDNIAMVESDFKISDDFLNIQKKNPNADLIVKISEINDSIANLLNKKNESFTPATTLYRIIIRDLNKKTSPDKGVILSMKTRSPLSKEEVEKEFLNSKTFLDIKKKNSDVDFHVKVEKVDDYDAVKDLELVKI